LDLLGLDTADLMVVEEFGMLAEAVRETKDGVEADTTEPSRGAATCAFNEVLGNGDEGILVGTQAEQGSIGALGEVRTAGGTV
jgi:hypothetical protein